MVLLTIMACCRCNCSSTSIVYTTSIVLYCNINRNKFINKCITYLEPMLLLSSKSVRRSNTVPSSLLQQLSHSINPRSWSISWITSNNPWRVFWKDCDKLLMALLMTALIFFTVSTEGSDLTARIRHFQTWLVVHLQIKSFRKKLSRIVRALCMLNVII